MRIPFAVAMCLLAFPAGAPAQTITEFPLPGGAAATGLTTSSGALWAAAPGGIMRVEADGTSRAIPVAGTVPFAIASGPDGRAWFAEQDEDGNGAVGAVAADGAVERFPDEIADEPGLADITPGATVMWFTESLQDVVGRINTQTGVVREFDLDIANGTATGVAVGPDDGIWFTETDSPGAIGRFDPGTEETDEFTAGLTEDGEPNDIVAGPQGALWFTTRGAIGRITTQGTITEFRNGITPGAFTRQLTVGPDGALWFTEANDRIGRLDPATGLITEFAAGITAGGRPEAITTGPDGNIWFTLPGTGRIGRLRLVPLEPTPTPTPSPTPTPAPAPEPPPPDLTPVDVVAPTLSGITFPRCLEASGRRSAVLGFTASEPGTLLVSLRRRDGSRPHAKCPGRIRAKRPGTSSEVGSTMLQAGGGSQQADLAQASRAPARRVVAGRNRARLAGLLGGRRLRPGTYILVLRAYDASGNRSPDTIVKLWVPRRR